ncbi:hypothetical protein RRG08_049680 [Elysia crispata]|uniref:Uncharacterized protein n=1 Tax=Elysia crispata TaxID=231223 RepID=A0AAE0Y625_9GAST|nr:hypothetical protein RRG08_049680 [Elysia crispata]
MHGAPTILQSVKHKEFYNDSDVTAAIDESRIHKVKSSISMNNRKRGDPYIKQLTVPVNNLLSTWKSFQALKST